MTSIFKPWLVAIIVLSALTLATCKSSIENDLSDKVLSVMESSNISNVEIHADGRDIRLTIDAKDRNAIENITTNTLAIKGVRAVEINSRPLPPLKTRVQEVLNLYDNLDWVRVEVDDSNNVNLFGQYHKPLLNQVLSQLSALEEINSITNQTELIDAPSALVENALSQFDVPWATVAVDDNKGEITITGSTTNKSLKDAMLQSIKNIEGVRKINDNVVLVEELNATMCQTEVDSVLQKDTILFAFNSAEIDSQSNNLLVSLADIASQCPNTNIEISGHTDSSGDRFVNKHISQLRAQSVLDALITLGVSANRLTAKGYGDSNPVASNNSAEGRQKNRRIELNITSIDSKAIEEQP